MAVSPPNSMFYSCSCSIRKELDANNSNGRKKDHLLPMRDLCHQQFLESSKIYNHYLIMIFNKGAPRFLIKAVMLETFGNFLVIL